MADSVFLKDFNLVDKTDVERFVAQAVTEGRTLDYKRDLPGSSDADGKEFLADISSFANSSGGYLIFGVDEERDANGKTTGVPAEAKGLLSTNAGAEIARLENMIRAGVAPRMAGIAAREIPGLANGPAIVFRVPRSWVGPPYGGLQGAQPILCEKQYREVPHGYWRNQVILCAIRRTAGENPAVQAGTVGRQFAQERLRQD